jgi:uncharacterized protein involved in outer membrane biogenesis
MTTSPYPRYALIASLLMVMLTLAIAFFPWRILRGPLASYASHQLQREVTIGALDVALGRITRVQLDEITIGNASWSDDQRMARASRMALFYSPGDPLRLSPDYVQLVQPDVLLEKSADGVANWQFGKSVLVPTSRRSTSTAASFATAILRLTPISA